MLSRFYFFWLKKTYIDTIRDILILKSNLFAYMYIKNPRVLLKY